MLITRLIDSGGCKMSMYNNLVGYMIILSRVVLIGVRYLKIIYSTLEYFIGFGVLICSFCKIVSDCFLRLTIPRFRSDGSAIWYYRHHRFDRERRTEWKNKPSIGHKRRRDEQCNYDNGDAEKSQRRRKGV